ncbi:Peptidyl-prolyl cis-trans isomerase Fpr3/Fpr4-like protein [Dioscorea alata]|uniref:Peptidyl-prolyl cis-trans isomerase Fpr3/Fpr4-like protein n=1 Tax=Dioscorea alata TaxID=55571 RepID=A0ACB7W6W6_DIOAL|nr:Peptidyl-prolyl cis-trans isomerase Fpr3/Fpr4-like protein [Dioscorea alata]
MLELRFLSALRVWVSREESFGSGLELPGIPRSLFQMRGMFGWGVVKRWREGVPALRGKDYGKTKMKFPDYTETQSGLQYKDLRVGDGPAPKLGETVVVDWDGYTIGYYGRIFEARNKTKGGSFEVIPAFEEAVAGMASGGIRRIIVPPELGYPDNDFNKLGPRPMTFSGQRALDFVLKNQGLIDKTLLFDIELLKIVPN